MDYREELLNRTMMRLNEAGVADLDRIRQILILSIGAYEISEKCTELAVVDNSDPEIVKMFLATKRIEGGSTRTARTRWCIIQKFCRDVTKPLREICTFDVLRWLANEQQRVSLSTAESYRTILASLFSWMAQSGIIEHSPMETIKPIKHPEVIKKSLNTVEVDALRSACKTKLKALADRAGVDGVSPHTFRHTFATVLYKRGLDVRMIQKLLGHSNINTTMIYIDSNLEMLRDAYKRCV